MKSRVPFVCCALLLAACAPGQAPDETEAAEEQAEALTASERALILGVANTASFTALDVDADLDKRAAESIVAGRPFATFEALDAAPYVGTSALDKLLAFAKEQGGAAPCLLISEYIEGSGNYNKAVELYNCGSSPIDLSAVGVCLVRNADATCTVTRALAARSLEPNDVYGVCRSKTGTVNDPFPWIKNACDEEMPGVMTFDGDDRLVVFHDADASKTFDAGDAVLDTFGVVASRPPYAYWADKVLRRCDAAPFNGLVETEFLPWERFTQHPRNEQQHYGTAPELGGCP
jgi:hypothetical protein